jgi:tetratricopeptide (TPR) repeat protein
MFKSNDVKKSKEYLQKSLDISIENNDSLGIARDLNNIAIIYQKQKIFDTAQVYYHQAMQINKEIGNWNYYATNLLNLANIEKQNENYEESIEIYSQLAFAFDSLNEKNKYALVLLHLGEAYLNINDYEKAINYFAIADSLGEKYSLTSIERNGNWGLYYCYNQLGENDLAIKYLQEQHKLDDIIRTKRNYQELTRLELHFRNDQLIKQKMWDQQKQKFILYFALALLLIFVAFLFQLFRKQKFKIAKEKLERKVLQNELEGKERELTSFVLNLIRLNEKKLGIITYLKKQRPRLKMENRDVIDTAIRDLEYDQDAQVWEEFEIRFNKVNSEFYQKLATSFPDLTLNEKRLCAFLLMNMTTKEIASITGQSTDAIGKARTRLRKKLGLTNQDESITSILDSL